MKTPSEDGFKNFVRDAKSRDKYVVVAGCVPQADRANSDIEGISVVGVRTEICMSLSRERRGGDVAHAANTSHTCQLSRFFHSSIELIFTSVSLFLIYV